MKLRITGHSGEGVFPFGVAGPWKDFENVFLERGHVICRDDFSEGADAIIANSFNSKIRNYVLNSNIPKRRRILVLWEPFIVETTRYQSSVRELFGSVYAPSVDWAERVGAKAFPWPQDSFTNDHVFDDWAERVNKVVVIQGNKFSARKGEQYSLRRKVLNLMNGDELSLYGTNWNKGAKFDWWHWSRSIINSSASDFSLKSIYGIGRKYDHYKGEVINKSQTLSKFQVSIVVENSLDFVSEKLFDSVRAGCVTIYVGPRLERYGISNDSALEVSNNPDKIVDLARSLLNLHDSERKSLAEAQYNALKPALSKSNNSKVLSSVAKDMIEVIEK